MHCFYLHLQSHLCFVSDPFKQKRTPLLFSHPSLLPLEKLLTLLSQQQSLALEILVFIRGAFILQLICRNFPFGARKKVDLSLHPVQALEGIPRPQVTQGCVPKLLRRALQRWLNSPCLPFHSLSWFMWMTKRTGPICQTIPILGRRCPYQRL